MSRIKVILLLSMLVVFGAVGTSSAWAGEYVIESKGLGEGETQEVAGTIGVSKLEASILKVKITIECLRGTLKGTIKPAGASEGVVSFKECRLLNEKHEVISSCKVHEPIEFRFTDQLGAGAGGKVEDEFRPTQTEETFVEITIEGGTCALRGTFKIKGTQVCELPKGEEQVVEHKIECKPSGSKLKMGSELAEFTGTANVKLASGKKWAMLAAIFRVTSSRDGMPPALATNRATVKIKNTNFFFAAKPKELEEVINPINSWKILNMMQEEKKTECKIKNYSAGQTCEYEVEYVKEEKGKDTVTVYDENNIPAHDTLQGK